MSRCLCSALSKLAWTCLTYRGEIAERISSYLDPLEDQLNQNLRR
jgi:hypothetical protein